jgi:hypothetical protein
MFVSIDMDTLQFLHKHHDQFVLNGLSFLECPHHSVRNENVNSEHFLLGMTPLEIRMLYRNTTGEDPTGSDDRIMREMLAMVVTDHMPPTLALHAEVEAQCKAVEDDLYNGIPWKYALGAKVPAKHIELFPFHCKPLDAVDKHKAAQQAPQRRAERAAPKPRAAAESAPQPAPAAKQRSSSVRPVIWSVADAMWEEAGKPMDKAVVLELRKKMMGVLEEKHSVKKTSSSNELGNWMKARLG